jgi:Flp pilus assembly protein TadD
MINQLNKTDRLHLLVILLFGLALYAPTLFHGFTLDDDMAIVGNEFTRQGLAGIAPILATDSWQGYFGEEVKLLPGGRYRPLSLVTFAIEFALFGENPLVNHLVNILIYALTGVLIYLVLFSLFRATRTVQWARLVSLPAALIFLAHPLHTEAAASIKGRDELLALFLALAALLLFLEGAGLKETRVAGGGSLLLLLAILAKENAFAFLAVIPLAIFFFRSPWQPAVKNLLPWLGGTALLYLAIRFAVLGFGGGPPAATESILNNPFLGMSPAEKYATIVHTLGRYLLLLAVPHPLTHDYYPKTIPVMSWTHWSVITSLILHLAALGWAIRAFRSRCRLSFLVLYYLLTLFVVSNIPFPIGTTMGERFLYMPSLAFCIAAALALARVGNRVSAGLLKKTSAGRATLLLALLIVIPFSSKTLHREQAWKDNITLFSTDISVSARSAKLQTALGCELLLESARPENQGRRQEMLDLAALHLNKAVLLFPENTQAWTGLGDVSYLGGDYAEAVRRYDRTLTIVPQSAEALQRKAQTLADWGKEEFARGRYAEALRHLRQSVDVVGGNADCWTALGAALGKLGRPREAIRAFNKAVGLDPDFAPAYLNLGVAYIHNGEEERGRQFLEKAYRLDPLLRP